MDVSHIELPTRREPLLMPWPVPGNPGGFIQFDHSDQWRTFIASLDMDSGIPDVVRLKYARAQKLYLLGWIDADLIKAGELVALTTLELALMDRYGTHFKKRKRTFAAVLKHLVDADGLTDAQIPVVARCGGSAIGQLIGTVKPTLAQRRNSMAHGDPFDGFPVGGLLELVRDLITFSYRHFIAEYAENNIMKPFHWTNNVLPDGCA
ncbi:MULTISPECIES: hypothetical protein [Paraburkholderia]|uniref:RiboL-PSP-HEPN domain-containing protein n=1 Tax=Paraburkholderia nemoris TaxID=2793076 RepID=A0ABM8T7U3_9BURK|nr:MULTISPECIES: hypothetical protein [Paraburkholderia]CAE6858195.1 hypothetical protein R75777_07902 [Paraburkholderia nemoris]CAE6862516.1 hypothetical protein R69776_08085 [Paraburkholderia nemoris]CAE6872315.1 hypothetical protein R69749_06315 [Paraburkholderia domus]